MSFYQPQDQKIFMFPESAALTPLNGTKVTQNPATYPWYSRLNVLPEGLDWDMPIRLKEKVWDIGSGKHPGHIINTDYEPVELTLDMMYQDARFLALATGTCTDTIAKVSSVEQDLDITCIGMGTEGALAEGDYFLLYTIDGDGHQICNALYIWIDTGSGPSITGCTNIKIDVSGGSGSGVNTTATEVAAAIATALTTETNYTCTSSSTIASVTVHGAEGDGGAVLDVRDSPSATATAFTFTYVSFAASEHTITEQTDNTMKTFGLHIEQANSGEDICVDLYGCVVTSYEITINYEDKVIKESVTIKAPYAVVGALSTIPPPRRISADPAVFAHFKETVDSYDVLALGGTGATPAIVNSVTFTIENDIDLYPEIGYGYRHTCIAGKRDVSLQIVGFIQVNDIWAHWKDTWDDAAGYYTNAAARLNSYIWIEQLATYDTFKLHVYNWLIEEYGLKLFTIDDKIMGIDVKFVGATPDASGYIIDSLVIKDYIPKIFYAEANA